MKLLVNKTKQVGGVVTPPSSKSETIRALLLATLARGKSVLHNVLQSDDTRTAINVFKTLGVNVEESGNSLLIKSSGVPLLTQANKINTGNSGITTRFVVPILGLRKKSQEEIILDCDSQMKQRPIKPLIEALQTLGLDIKCLEEDGKCPLNITGSLKSGEIKIDGLTSQYLSALLLSGPCVNGGLKIMVENLNERPYVDMTLAWLDKQNIEYKHYQMNGQDIFHLVGGQEYRPFTKIIPVDFSSASYLIATAVLIPGEVVIKNIDMNEVQGDKRIINILKDMGADITIQNNELLIRGGKPLHGITIDANDIPDMVPTLAVVATQAEGETKIINVAQARIKETDRINSMAMGLGAMGVYVEEKPDGLIIKKSLLHGAEVDGFGDHRTVMALALAGLLADGETVISMAEAVNKTFPSFVTIMNSLGCKIKVVK